MFFQWVLCFAIGIVGAMVQFIQNFPTFWHLAMVGGFLWATGNIMVVPIIKTIGLALGLLIWGSFNLLTGWAISRFGWLGIDPKPLEEPIFSYFGAGLSVLSIIVFLFEKTDVESSPPISEYDVSSILVNAAETETDNNNDVSWVDSLSPLKKRAIGCFLAAIAGILYGSSFVPMLYIKDHAKKNAVGYEGASQNDIDYVPAQFIGVFVISTIYFFIYVGVRNYHPKVYPETIIPGLLSGILLAISSCGWSIANHYFTAVVSYPIITAGPGFIAAVWGVLVFKELKGLKNYVLLIVGFCFILAGSLSTSFWKA
ncbi:transmembrane protein 144-like [Anolis sagrei]|uniref:transmembrane protein 144-like n=1 Tax=Anolis sagrei TaxID=38937 RepID=UPI0035224B07